jgi:drug/metabolite transporter (DMT)-like permease
VTFAVVFALAAAFSNAVNLMTQHSASVAAPEREKRWRLGLYLAREPLWLLGGAAAVGSYAFQTLALHNGPMSVVQPVLVAELVFVMVLRRVWIRQHVAAAWAAVFTVTVALAVFLAAAEPTGGQPAPRAAKWLSAGLVFGGAVAVLAMLGTRGLTGPAGPQSSRRRRSPGPWRRRSSRPRPTPSPPPSPARCSSGPRCTSGR